MELHGDDASLRALDPKCGNPKSSDSRRTVVKLANHESLEFKAAYMHSAVYLGLSNLVRCALTAKISPDTRWDENNTPVLVLAAGWGRVRVLKQLLDAGADHSLTDSGGFTAMTVAAQRGFLEIVQLLLAAGIDVNKADVLGMTPLVHAVRQSHTEVVRVLIPASDLLHTTCAGQTAAHACAFAGSVDILELLLDSMSDVDFRTVAGTDENGKPIPHWNESSLLIACSNGQRLMAKALLRRSASRMAKNNQKQTPLHCAAISGHLLCVVLLVGPEKKKMTPEEVDAKDINGRTALHLTAAKSGSEHVCGVLLEAGARLDAMDSDGWTPLMHAQESHPTNAALHALLSGADPANLPGTVCDHCGKTAAQASVNCLQGCKQCSAVRYCGAACQTAAWPAHKKACKARAAELKAMRRVSYIVSPRHPQT